MVLAQTLEEEAYEKAVREKKYPKFAPGDVVELKLVRAALRGRRWVGSDGIRVGVWGLAWLFTWQTSPSLLVHGCCQLQCVSSAVERAYR